MKTIPCHLIAGPLGVGKTTAIRNYVAKSSAFTAVVVNDFGETGYDAAFISESSNRLHVENVAGGCLCCTSVELLVPALKTLCARPDVERIIIEPSGVAQIDPLLNMLRAAALKCGFELMPVIVIFDPSKNRPSRLTLVPYWRRLAECAGIIVANRCDLATVESVAEFMNCFKTWRPRKLKLIQTSHGELPPEIFELRGGENFWAAEHRHHHADLPAAGIFYSDETFRFSALIQLLEKLAPQLERFKGQFKTEQGWYRLEIAGGAVHQTPADAKLRTSAEWVGAGDEIKTLLRQI